MRILVLIFLVSCAEIKIKQSSIKYREKDQSLYIYKSNISRIESEFPQMRLSANSRLFSRIKQNPKDYIFIRDVIYKIRVHNIMEFNSVNLKYEKKEKKPIIIKKYKVKERIITPFDIDWL